MKNLQAILFCGGRGSRLYPITDFYQKVMMPIGKDGKPLLEYVINHIKSFGVTEFIALVGYRHNLIKRYFGDGSSLGINLTYVVDNPNYKGTGGALYNARNYISKNDLLIYYTDILTNINLNDIHNFYRDTGSKGTVWVDSSWKIVDGVVEINEQNSITKISHKPVDKIYANTGISILNSDIILILEDFVLNYSKTNLDLSSDVLPRLVQKKELFAYDREHWWLDVGSLKRYNLINDEMISEKFGDE